MYEWNSLWIAGALFALMGLVIEGGYRLGRSVQRHSNEPSRTHVNAIQASIVGMLALLLGFTFSLSLQRYDSRSIAVVNESNAIGTTYLRAGLLPAPLDEEVRGILRDYLQLRIESAGVSLVEHDARQDLLQRTRDMQGQLWQRARQAVAVDDRPTTTGLFIQSLNEMFDELESRHAALARHVPESVLYLLFGTFLMTGTIVGYASGMAGHRASFITYLMVGLIVLLVFIIIDLDRPRRGLIEVDQQSMLELRSAMGVEP